MYWDTLASAYLCDPEHRFVLASLIRKTGSSYLQPGARMLVREDGAHWGGISAGCLEENIAGTAVDCLRTGQHRIIEIDTRPYFGCFGQITVLLEILPVGEMTDRLFQSVRRHLVERKHFSIVTHYADLSGDGLTRIGESMYNGDSLTEQVNPVPRILVFGDWPDAQAVVKISGVMGWDVVAFDASSPGFSVAGAIQDMPPDKLTAAMVMTHNFARDTLLLKHLLRLPFGYVGLIGSRKRREEVCNELAGEGDMELIVALDKLSCPAGLDLGGEGHEAIALAVVAEIQSSFHQRNAAPLRHKQQAVHTDNHTR